MIRNILRSTLDVLSTRLVKDEWRTLQIIDPQMCSKQAGHTPPTYTWQTWGKPLGIEAQYLDGALHCTRHQHKIKVQLDEFDLNALSWTQTRQISSAFLAARLILDAQELNYNVDMERPSQPDVVWRKEDIPTTHGERFPWIVPSSVLRTLEAHHIFALHTPIDQTDLHIIYVQEFGNLDHVLTQKQAKAHPLGDERLKNDAKQALFYQSYRVRPHLKEQHPEGVIKYYETTEGLGASRLLLLPDFDFDTARAHGFCAIPTRRLMLTAQPDDSTQAQAMFKRLEASLKALEHRPWPLSQTIFTCNPEHIEVLPTQGPTQGE